MLQSVQEWDLDFAAFVAKLGKTKPVIVAGDFNCEHPSLIAVSVQVLWGFARRSHAGVPPGHA